MSCTASLQFWVLMAISISMEEQPAFYHQYEYLRGHKLGVIKFNPAVAERMSKDSVAETLHPRHLPMLVKPKPWLSYNQGGYLYNRSWAMRFKDSREQEVYLRHASDAGRLELVFAGLDVLGSTPWRINRRVFDVVLQVWNSGERFCKIPPAVPDEPEPARPENMEFDNKAKTVYIERQKMWQQAKAANHSDRCSVNYKVEIARAVSIAARVPSRTGLTTSYSSWVIPSTSPTTSTSVVVHTPSLLT